LVAFVGFLLAKEASAFEVNIDPNPDEVQLTPLAAPPYELAPFQFRECKFTAAFFATSSDLSEFVPDELETVEPPAAPGTTIMIAFGGECPRTTMGPCAFTLILAPVKLNLPGHPEDGNFLGMYPIHSYVSNENYYKYCEVIGGCPLKLGKVNRKENGNKVKIKFERKDIRPINENGEFDIMGEPPKKATELVKLTVESLAPLDNATLQMFEDATGLPFRNSLGELAFAFPPLVNLKMIPSADAYVDVIQLTRVPFAEQNPTNAMFGPTTLDLFSSVGDPIADNVSVDIVFGGVNFDFEFEFGWPAGDILHDYLAP
jgi:acetoacetate decarboxylase